MLPTRGRMPGWALLLLACTVAVLSSASASSPSSPASTSSFEETLLLRPLHDGKLLLHFDFVLSESGHEGGAHFALFPKSLGQILNSFGVRSLALSLSSGRWSPEAFGYESMDAAINATSDDSSGHSAADRFTPTPNPMHAPHGAELWAVLDEEDEEVAHRSIDAGFSPVRGSVDSRWHQLQAALSGLFCASLNQMGALTSSHPDRILRPAGDGLGSFRYATLPRESVCTENLAPFVKLLPCRSKRGLGALLNPLKLYRAHFHSIQIRVEPITDAEGSVHGWTLRQSVSVLIDPTLIYQSPNWSLSQLLGNGGACACSLAKRASMHVHLPAAFSARFPESVQALHSSAAASAVTSSAAPRARFQLNSAADLVRRYGSHSLLSYDLKTHSSSNVSRWSACPRGAIDLAMSYTPAAVGAGKEAASVFDRKELEEVLAMQPQQPAPSAFEYPIEVQRYISSSSLHSGVLHILLHNPAVSRATFRVQLFDALPYFCQIAYSTLRITLDGLPLPPDALLAHSYTPAVLRGSPAQLFFSFRLAANSTLSLSIDFSKEMLPANDYPPDVSRGFDIGSAIVSVQRLDDSGSGSEPLVDSPRIVFYTSGLLLLLPFPDFSMPFNVIAFTSTVLAFFWGSLFNMSYGSYEQVLKRKPRRERDEQGKTVTIASNIKKMICKKKKKDITKDAQASEVQLTAATTGAAAAEFHSQ